LERISILDFNNFVALTLAKPQRHVFLTVFLEKKPAAGVFTGSQEGVFVKFLASGAEFVAPGLDFKLFCQHAEDNQVNWDLAAIVPGNNNDGSMPSVEQCTVWLEDIEKRIASGDMHQMAIFDRNGDSLTPIASKIVSGPSSTTSVH
jgi:hypothetical protein